MTLNVLTLPLRGSGLIEASAGTGKTWTLAALYVRLVLGHGQSVLRQGVPLLPSHILVMTFTRAATRELSERIRARLVEAAAVFRGLRSAASDDTFLATLLADYSEASARQTAAWRLESAAQAMDDAAIHTLDAWCQRVLREHAFDHDAPLDSEVLPDSTSLMEEAARDIWRQQVYPLSAAALAAVQELWLTPASLVGDVRVVGEREWPQPDPAVTIDQVVSDSLQALSVHKQACLDVLDDMQAWLEDLLAVDQPPLSRIKIPWEKAQIWLQKLRAWALDPVLERPDITDKSRERLTPAGLRDARNKGKQLVDMPEAFDVYQRMLQALDAVPSRATAIRSHATALVLQRMRSLKEQRLLQSHIDVQRRLCEALDPGAPGDPRGERARRLRERILDQYPAALVDEFQDTSPVQRDILDRLYRIEADDPAHVLLLIGDPKQSIYAFRGADIHSYLQVRRATAGRHHVLGTNHRSTAEVVAAVNAVFEGAEQRPGEGAFRFGNARADGTAAEERIPFEPVNAQGRAQTFQVAGRPVPAMNLCVDSELRSATESRRLYANRCAQAIVAMLSAPDSGFSEPGQALQPLRPGDVAVLVRSHYEAAMVRQAMADRGLPSVFMSDRDSVFETPEAADVLRWLQAVNAPRDARLARAALATELLGLSLAELIGLADDGEAFERQAERLGRLQAVWRGQGVLAMLRAALHEWQLPARWLQSPDGERRLTNVLHLGELLQAAQAQLEGPATLLRWLRRQMDGLQADGETGAAGRDERVLRLESDADRVQVITLHKAKGLEYPVVFLPFATHFRDPGRRRPWALWLHDAQGQRRVVVQPTEEDQAQDDLEQQREDLRLLYVALTRARFALWVGASMHTVGSNKACAWNRSALGYLVSSAEPRTPPQIEQDLSALVARAPQIHLQWLGQADDPALQPALRWRPVEVLVPLAPARNYTAQFDRQWAISSYSALVRDAASVGSQAPPAEDVDNLGWLRAPVLLADEPAVVNLPAPLESAAQSSLAPWHHFPRGAFAGNFLHGQLEWLAGEGFALARSASLQQALLRRCEREGWGHRSAEVLQWLTAVCERHLPPLQQPLHALDAVLPEMEFWLPSDGLRTAELDRLCREHVLPGLDRPALVERQLRGMLMGFADLVLEHDGRWWVLDHKSNALGLGDESYDQPALERALLAHRYDVQAVLYLLPLHRLLRSRLGAGYLPQQHLGGAIYLFLRGIAAPGAGCLTLAPPWALLEALDATLPQAADALPQEQGR